jgi:tryptophan synthase beta chain
VIPALQLLSEMEGIIPALEPAHAIAWVTRAVKSGEIAEGQTILVTLSGRGDKDVAQVMDELK